jgi:hypothetical protein
MFGRLVLEVGKSKCFRSCAKDRVIFKDFKGSFPDDFSDLS